MRRKSTARAFSLTELLIVVSVVLVLMAILIVSTQAVHSHAMRLKCQHRLEQIGHALHMYSSGNHGLMPKAWDMYSGQLWYQTLAQEHLTDWNVLGCPSVGIPPSVSGGGAGTAPGARENVNDLLEVLRWLKDNQEDNGSWRDTSGSYHTGVTGLALLAFFGFGCTDKNPPEFAETVRKAIDYLCSPTVQQKTDADGKKGWFIVHGYKYMYTQPICVMALCGAARVCTDSALREEARQAAQLGFDFIVDRQSDEGAFGYYGPLDSYQGYWRGDTSTTAWGMQSIAAARVAGLDPTNTTWPEISAKIEDYLQIGGCMDSSGRSSYWFNAANHGSGGLAMTPLSLTSRMLNGGKPSDPLAVLQADYLMDGNRYINHAVARDAEGKPINYHIYYACLALYRMGGSYWTRWYEGGTSTPSNWEGYPKLVLKRKQSAGVDPEGNSMAFWENDTCWADACGNPAVTGTRAGGRVFTTCMAALALESAFEEHWIDPSWTPVGGTCSYGYNNRLGQSRRSVAADTILVMDYEHWEIDRDDIDVEKNDGPELIAPRHGGLTNALLGDGSVRALDPDQIDKNRFTLTPAD
jgi:prepilin-type processing-associated H-X9-DG protein